MGSWSILRKLWRREVWLGLAWIEKGTENMQRKHKKECTYWYQACFCIASSCKQQNRRHYYSIDPKMPGFCWLKKTQTSTFFSNANKSAVTVSSRTMLSESSECVSGISLSQCAPCSMILTHCSKPGWPITLVWTYIAQQIIATKFIAVL